MYRPNFFFFTCLLLGPEELDVLKNGSRFRDSICTERRRGTNKLIGIKCRAWIRWLARLPPVSLNVACLNQNTSRLPLIKGIFSQNELKMNLVTRLQDLSRKTPSAVPLHPTRPASRKLLYYIPEITSQSATRRVLIKTKTSLDYSKTVITTSWLNKLWSVCLDFTSSFEMMQSYFVDWLQVAWLNRTIKKKKTSKALWGKTCS